MPEAKIQVVQPHSPSSRVQVHAAHSPTASLASQRLVSEMMILTGQAIASIGVLIHQAGPQANAVNSDYSFVTASVELGRQLCYARGNGCLLLARVVGPPNLCHPCQLVAQLAASLLLRYVNSTLHQKVNV